MNFVVFSVDDSGIRFLKAGDTLKNIFTKHSDFSSTPAPVKHHWLAEFPCHKDGTILNAPNVGQILGWAKYQNRFAYACHCLPSGYPLVI
jgi:hypothetical protein